MVAPVIPPIENIPNPADDPAVFDADSFAFTTNSLPTMVDNINGMAQWMNELAEEIEGGGSMPDLTMKGNDTGATAASKDLTVAEVVAMLQAAMLANAALTGNPTAPTAAASDNDTSIATTAQVKSAISYAFENANRLSLTVTTSANLTAGTFYYWVFGKIVFYSFQYTIVTGNVQSQFGTIPLAHRPAWITHNPAYVVANSSQSAQILIDPSGAIYMQIQGAASGTTSCTGSWRIA